MVLAYQTSAHCICAPIFLEDGTGNSHTQKAAPKDRLPHKLLILLVSAWGFEPQTPTVSTVVISPLFATLTNVLRKNDRACIACDA
jgi:hypothetical protein